MKSRWLYAGIGYLITLIGSYFVVQFIHNNLAPIPSGTHLLVLFFILSPLPNISHFFSIGIGYYMGLRKEYTRKLRKRSLGAIIGYLLSVFIWLIAGSQLADPSMMLSVFVIGIIPINLPHSILLLIGHFIGKNFETAQELKEYQFAKTKMKQRNKNLSNEPNKNSKSSKPSYNSGSTVSSEKTELTKSTLRQRLNDLKQRNEQIFLADIEKILKRNSASSKIEADKLISEREQNFNQYQSIFGEISDIRSKIMKLTDRIAVGELDSETYKRALNDLETQLRESEEALWGLRTELFREEYEKPF